MCDRDARMACRTGFAWFATRRCIVFNRTAMAGKYRLTTLGCKVNQCESQQVRRLLESAGYRPAKSGERADVAVVNTCAVTCSATAKSRQSLRRLARSADQTIAIGCYATAEPDNVAKLDGVTEVIGHDSDALARIGDLIARKRPANPQAGEAAELGDDPVALRLDSSVGDETLGYADEASQALVQVGLALLSRRGNGQRTNTPNYPASQESTNNNSIRTEGGEVKLRQPGNTESALQSSRITRSDAFDTGGQTFVTGLREFSGRTRAFLKIQDGCDASCTYCIIPKLRTRLRSKPIAEAVAEARALVAGGHREIVLTGIFLGAYGRETAIRKRFTQTPSPLAGLVDALAGVDGLERLRLSSLEPGDVDDALLSAIARHSNCVPHFHLPLQSGCGEILRRMNRQYTVDAFVEMIDRVRAALDRPAITTDVIVGFPGETDAMFQETLAVARHAGFCKIHAFPFSPRPGTAAARWNDQYVHQQSVKDRMSTLANLESKLARQYINQFVGQTQRVLVESRHEDKATSKAHRTPRTKSSGLRPRRPTPDEALHPPNSTGSVQRRQNVQRDTGRYIQNQDALISGRTDRYFEVWFESPAAQPGDLANVRIDRVTPTRVHGVACDTLSPTGTAASPGS